MSKETGEVETAGSEEETPGSEEETPGNKEEAEKPAKLMVPMNFGRQHLGLLVHDNLTFQLEDGLELKANSLILSFNSPVIATMTAEFLQTSIQVEEFTESAVSCFIDACYSGELAKLTKDNFREVNKMARVFDVTWMINRCRRYYLQMVGEMTGEDLAQVHYIVDEAEYLLKARKDPEFIKCAVAGIATFTLDQRLEYVESVYESACSGEEELKQEKVEMLLKIARSDHVIQKSIIKRHVTSEKLSLQMTDTVRFILKNIDLASDDEDHNRFIEEMFDVLNKAPSTTVDDMRMIFDLYKQRCSDLKEGSIRRQSENEERKKTHGKFIWTQTLDQVLSFTEELRSHPLLIGDIPWSLRLRELLTLHDSLGCFLSCDLKDRKSAWSYPVRYSITLIRSGCNKSKSPDQFFTFDSKHRITGEWGFVSREELMNKDCSFVKNNKIRIKLEIEIEAVSVLE